MGVNTRRPPLPVPTETGSSMDDTSALDTGTEVATNVTARTDNTHYSVPEDGSPITISTHRTTTKEGGLGRHGRQKSQTSLLIEYFEASKTGDKSRSRPSVRVKVTPSAKKNKQSDGAVQITSIGKDRKPSYTRRISLSGRNADTLEAPQATEVSHSSESNLSASQPIEVEIQNGSDLSTYNRSSRGLQYAPMESNVSSMPPDSLLAGGDSLIGMQPRSIDQSEPMSVAGAQEEEDTLKVPRKQRSRSLSRERLAQKVMEKIQKDPGIPYKSSNSSSHHRSQSYEDYRSNERRRRTSKDLPSGGESSLLSSNPNGSNASYRSDRSQTSRMTNNPKLLEMVEDTIKRMILPEINQIKRDRSVKEQSFDRESGNLGRSLSKHSSSPNIKTKPKVVLNRDGDDPGTVLSRGDSEHKKSHRSGKDQSSRPSSRRSSSRLSSLDREQADERTVSYKSSRSSNKLRDTAAAGLATGILTAAALKSHNSQSDGHLRRKRKGSRSHTSRSRSASIADTTDEAYGYEKDENMASPHSRGSRSRSTSFAKSTDEAYAYEREANVPAMPMASAINESEITRQSILSSVTDRPSSRSGSADLRTPIREVSRGSLAETMSPASSRTPTRTSNSRGLGMSHANQSIDSPSSVSTKERKAKLAAAGLNAARSMSQEYRTQIDADGYGSVSPSPISPRRGLDSPAQSVSSLRQGFEGDEGLMPSGLRPHSAASRSSAGQIHTKQRSLSSLQSAESSPSTKLARSRKQSQDEYPSPIQDRGMPLSREGTQTPGDESVDEWYERQHQLNDRYRDSLGATTNRDSYQTNPYPEDARRFTAFSDESQDTRDVSGLDTEQGVREVSGLNPQYVHRSFGVESNVASLMEPSMLTASTQESSVLDSPSRTNGTYSERMAEHLGRMSKDDAPIYEGSSLSQNMPSENRWAEIRGAAKSLSTGSKDDMRSMGSPSQSPVKSLQREFSMESEGAVRMGASGLPDMDDPMPEIGHFDDSKSESAPNQSRGPSIVHGHLGGDDAGRNAWPYTPSPVFSDRSRQLEAKESRSLKSGHSRDEAYLGVAAGGAATAAAALAAQNAMKQPTVEDQEDRNFTPVEVRHGGIDIDREATPTGSPAAFRDEGYVTNDARSAGALTPKAEQINYSREQLDDFNRAMSAQDLGGNDPFAAQPGHVRQASGASHGMASPLYDSATGQGLDRFESKDIVHLMDHLTVRDAQRNARDTEILVTLVRTATEMRTSFDEMKRFIAEQDRMIMRNTDRDAEQTVNKVLNGPRPQPMSPRVRTPRQQSQEDIQKKRKGVLRRALNGLTGNKNSNDISKIEDMFMQILDEVEDLKHQGGPAGQRELGSYASESLDSYEKLRAAPDSGYEPEGQAGTSSTPSHSGNLLQPVSKHQFHSGYNGRSGSNNRVSTVLEGSEEDDDGHLEPHEARLLTQQPVLGQDRYPTPTHEVGRSFRNSPHGTPQRFAERGLQGSPRGTPPYNGPAVIEDSYQKSAEKQRKHKSNNSSIFGGPPKVSRWSRTTASSGPPDPVAVESPTLTRNQRPISAASRSTADEYDDVPYRVSEDDKLRSTHSLARETDRNAYPDETRSIRSQASKLTRTSSPLIPSEVSYGGQHEEEEERQIESPVQEDVAFDDPKYQAHRNSLLLQHPQPRQGPTGRHQNTLENQAHAFGDDSGPPTESDVSQRTVSDFDPAMWGSSGTAALARNRMSQAEPLSPISMGSGYGKGARRDESLIPQKQAQAQASAPAPVQAQTQETRAPQTQYEDEDFSEDDEEYDDDDDWEPDYSHSGYARNPPDYSSPYGSGHLLEPIEEVRYSLETDSGHISLPPTQRIVGGSRRRNKNYNSTGNTYVDREASPEPMASVGTAMRSPARKITGPRPMGSKSPAQHNMEPISGTVRRKPIARSQESFDSDTF